MAKSAAKSVQRPKQPAKATTKKSGKSRKY